MTDQPAEILSHFWAPLCAVGSHGGRGPNAQICVSVFGASIVPEQPRLLVNLSNTNYTTELVRESGTVAITLLAEGQAGLLEPLGLHSGREGSKLSGLDVELSSSGDPFFPGGVGVVLGETLEAFDLGDMTAFLVAVRERRELGGSRALPWNAAREVVGEEFLRRWAEKSAREQAAARAVMRWE